MFVLWVHVTNCKCVFACLLFPKPGSERKKSCAYKNNGFIFMCLHVSFHSMGAVFRQLFGAYKCTLRSFMNSTSPALSDVQAMFVQGPFHVLCSVLSRLSPLRNVFRQPSVVVELSRCVCGFCMSTFLPSCSCLRSMDGSEKSPESK